MVGRWHDTLCGLNWQVVVDWLIAQPQVHWVSPRPQTKAANFFATGISQVGMAATFAQASNTAPGASGDSGTHPFWDAGNMLCQCAQCFWL